MNLLLLTESIKEGRKAEVLELLRPRLTKAHILPSVTIKRGDWRRDPDGQLSLVGLQAWHEPLIVRSSASTEDSATQSAAGQFHTVGHVSGRPELNHAIGLVFASYDRGGLIGDDEHVLIQPMVVDASLSGVAAARDHATGGPYRVINWSSSGRTDDVTSGRMSNIRTWYEATSVRPTRVPRELTVVADLLDELAQLIGQDFEIEFALSRSLGLTLFQVRGLARMGAAPSDAVVGLELIATRVAAVLEAATAGRTAMPIPGGRTLLGVMPDWNPAEIIGTRPRRLASSLYRRLITDSTWAEARADYGYRNVVGTPILVDLCGLPYIDVRASAASLTPAALPAKATSALVNHYVERLAEAPHLHDKFEFEVVLSAWLPGSELWIRQRLGRALSCSDQLKFGESLRRLTDDLVRNLRPWIADLAELPRLETGRSAATALATGSPERIELLLGSARMHGARPFAGLARGAFIATQMLRHAASWGVTKERDAEAFLAGASMVTTDLVRDFSSLSHREFLARYGHLRPGTYDILSPRYDETPDRYLPGLSKPSIGEHSQPDPRSIDLSGLDSALGTCGLSFGTSDFREFALATIRGREVAKFESPTI